MHPHTINHHPMKARNKPPARPPARCSPNRLFRCRSVQNIEPGWYDYPPGELRRGGLPPGARVRRASSWQDRRRDGDNRRRASFRAPTAASSCSNLRAAASYSDERWRYDTSPVSYPAPSADFLSGGQSGGVPRGEWVYHPRDAGSAIGECYDVGSEAPTCQKRRSFRISQGHGGGGGGGGGEWRADFQSDDRSARIRGAMGEHRSVHRITAPAAIAIDATRAGEGRPEPAGWSTRGEFRPSQGATFRKMDVPSGSWAGEGDH